ncbi:hypothetical protein HG530_008686 [Fusarium avenaceum]|nr:hypothetical protein HG530_008686 [Fusarium avenaceum]
MVLRREKLAHGPHGQLGDEILAIRPNMIVLGILFQHGGDKLGLRSSKLTHCLTILLNQRVVVIHEELAMIPNLVVLQIRQCHLVQPDDLIGNAELENRNNLEAEQPDGVVCWVHGDDVLSSVGNDGRTLGIVVRVGNLREGALGFVLRNGNDIVPFGVLCQRTRDLAVQIPLERSHGFSPRLFGVDLLGGYFVLQFSLLEELAVLDLQRCELGVLKCALFKLVG